MLVASEDSATISVIRCDALNSPTHKHSRLPPSLSLFNGVALVSVRLLRDSFEICPEGCILQTKPREATRCTTTTGRVVFVPCIYLIAELFPVAECRALPCLLVSASSSGSCPRAAEALLVAFSFGTRYTTHSTGGFQRRPVHSESDAVCRCYRPS